MRLLFFSPLTTKLGKIMVKEFQQLRKQMIQLLLEQQQQQNELAAQSAKQEAEKKRLFLDIIAIIELLAQKEEIAIRAFKLEPVSSQNTSEIYNNIKNNLVKLLAKHDVRPITENTLSMDTKFNQKSMMKTGEVSPKIRFSYGGEFLNE